MEIRGNFSQVIYLPMIMSFPVKSMNFYLLVFQDSPIDYFVENNDAEYTYTTSDNCNKI